jgi:methylated-DNA-protein-cysteine methyltransferase-like protein
MDSSVERIVEVLRSIPEGTVASYGEVAEAAGVPRGARLVARVLSSMSRKHGLPWHRVVRADRRIALPRGGGFELQKALLEAEGLRVAEDGSVLAGAGSGR